MILSRRTAHAVLTAAVLAVLLSCACSRTERPSVNYRLGSEEELSSALQSLKEYPDDVTLNISVWYYFTEKGQWDSVINYAVPVFRRSMYVPGKEQLMLYAGAYASQAFVFSERFDSLSAYIDRIIPLSDGPGSDDFLRAMINNIAGQYAMKAEGDYAEALDRYKNALESLTRIGDTLNRSIMLGNIASIYYHRKDTAGYRYARQAVELSNAHGDSYSIVYSTLQAAQMLYLKKQYRAASEYAGKISGAIDDFPQFKAQYFMLYGNIYAALGLYGKAEEYYDTALSYGNSTEPGTLSSVYLNYGRMLWAKGSLERAAGILRKGLSVTENNGNIEYRHELLLALSELYSAMGEKDKALDYYKSYHEYAEKIFNIQKERAFQKLETEEERAALQEEIQQKELALEKAKRERILNISISGIILIILIALYVIYHKQKGMYRQLVEAHQQYMNRTELIRKSAETQNDTKNKDSELWKRIEGLMRNGKVYRRNDISLESIADMLSTNRVYVSKAINTFAGMSFYKYINSYRIEESVAILSGTDDNIPMKALADRLGYNSLSAFYRAFQQETGCPPSRYRSEAKKIRND